MWPLRSRMIRPHGGSLPYRHQPVSRYLCELAALSNAFRPTSQPQPARRLAGLSMVQRIGFDGSGLAATHLQRISNTNADSA
jgi:hypothetical protein